jgi:tetratricopeptide (TPR) repeat protein
MFKRSPIIAALAILALGSAAAASAGWDEGVAAFQAKNYQQAAVEFQEVVEQQPDLYQGHYMLGQSLAAQKKMQDALPHLRKAYDLNPNDLGVQMVLGKAYTDSRRYADAVSVLGKVDASKLPGKNRVALHQMLAKAYEKTGDERRMRGALKSAADADPNNADLRYAYGAAAFNAGDVEGAIAALAKAVQLDAGDAKKQKTYAQALLRKGRTTNSAATKADAYKKASAALVRVVAKDDSYDNLIMLAGAQLGAKQYDPALSSLERAAGKNSNDWLPQYYMGQAHTQKEQFRSAEEKLKEALGKAGKNEDKVTIYSQLGYVYEKQKRYDNAIAAYRSAGNDAGVKRAEENKATDAFNKDVEKEAAERAAMKAEEDRLKEQLKSLPGAKPPTP